MAYTFARISTPIIDGKPYYTKSLGGTTMGKYYIIGAALATGIAGIAFLLGAGTGGAICAAGKFNVYYLEGGGRVVAYFLPKAKIPHSWSEARKKCIAYTFIED